MRRLTGLGWFCFTGLLSPGAIAAAQIAYGSRPGIPAAAAVAYGWTWAVSVAVGFVCATFPDGARLFRDGPSTWELERRLQDSEIRCLALQVKLKESDERCLALVDREVARG